MNVLHYLLPVLGIGFVIFFHELGHFMAARAMGVRVEAFSIGFGPRLFGFRRGATDWKICLIPLGGFVKMAGETPNAPRTGAADEFTSKSVAARSLIISAGVIMNVIFALLALPIAFLFGVPFETPVIGSVDPLTPAWKAGIRGGDRIVSVDGRRTLGYEDVVTAVAIGGDVVSIDIERAGHRLHRDVVTERDPRRGLPVIGVNPSYAPFEIKAEDVDEAEAVEGGRAVAAHRFAAGLRHGDQITSVDGIPISELRGAELTEVKTRTLKVLRGDASLSLVMPPLGTPDVVDADEPEPFGLIPAGLVAKEIVGDSPAMAAGLRKGDRIRAIGDREVLRMDEMALALSDAPADAELIVDRGGQRESLGRASAPDLARSLRTDVDYDAVGRIVVPLEESAALKAGIRRGDEIVTVNGAPLESFADIRRIDKTVRTATFGVRRQDGDGKIEDIQVTRARLPVNQALLGLERRYVRETVKEGFGGSLKAGFDYTVMMTARIFKTLKSLFGRVSMDNLGGIITIFRQSAESSKIALSRGLLFMAVISLNLAVINVLPIPVLDGGWLLLLIIERVRGRPVSERVLGIVSWIGLVLILGLMLFVTWNDIRRLWF